MKIAPDELKALGRFRDCAEDTSSGGHDVSKDMMRRLTALGVVRSMGFGRHETTDFGDWVLAQPPQTHPAALPVIGDLGGDNRALFESIVRKKGWQVDLVDDAYRDVSTRYAWAGWEACRTLLASQEPVAYADDGELKELQDCNHMRLGLDSPRCWPIGDRESKPYAWLVPLYAGPQVAAAPRAALAPAGTPFHVAEGPGPGKSDVLVHIWKGSRRIATLNENVFASRTAVREQANAIVTALNAAGAARAAAPTGSILVDARARAIKLQTDIEDLNALLQVEGLPVVEDVKDVLSAIVQRLQQVPA